MVYTTITKLIMSNITITTAAAAVSYMYMLVDLAPTSFRFVAARSKINDFNRALTLLPEKYVFL